MSLDELIYFLHLRLDRAKKEFAQAISFPGTRMSTDAPYGEGVALSTTERKYADKIKFYAQMLGVLTELSRQWKMEKQVSILDILFNTIDELVHEPENYPGELHSRWKAHVDISTEVPALPHIFKILKRRNRYNGKKRPDLIIKERDRQNRQAERIFEKLEETLIQTGGDTVEEG